MRLVAVVVSAAMGVAVVAPAAEAHNGPRRGIEVVAVTDTERADHSVLRVRFRPGLQGKTVRVFVEHKLLWGCSKETPHCKGYRGIAVTEQKVRLPNGRTTTHLSIPVDVATRPGTKHPDAIRVTNVDVVFRNQYARGGMANVRSVTAGDPGDWSPAGSRPVWYGDWSEDHYHRVKVRR